MSISMYQASIPVFLHTLDNLSNILKKAASHAEQRKIDPSVLLASRLYPDMFPLLRQVQIAADLAKGASARLAGIERPVHEDNETTFDDLQARIEKTRAFLGTLTSHQIDGSEERPITLTIRGKDFQFAGQPYLLQFALPNFYFHVTISYAILRHCGVALDKPDFIGGLPN